MSITTCELSADKQGENTSKQNFWSSCVVFTEEERGQKRKRELDEEGEEDEDWTWTPPPLWSDRLTPVYLSYCHSSMVWGGIQMVGGGASINKDTD